MNKQIKELAIQAGLEWKVAPLHFTNTRNPINFPKDPNIELNEFAKLIVAATLEQVNEHMELTWIEGEVAIKKHFGVTHE